MLFLDFEDSIATLEAELAELRHGGGGEDEARLAARIDRQLEGLYARLTPWQTVQVARHPDRPSARDVVRTLGGGFLALAGDRAESDSRHAEAGVARVHDHGVVLIGHSRAPDAAALRKTARLLRLAERFRLPAILVADGGCDDAQALAACLDAALDLRVPLIAVVAGAVAGPGAALPLAADAVLMLEHACLSAVTPEDAARAHWTAGGDAARAHAAAAEALHLTAKALAAQGLVDAVVDEPTGGAHRHPRAAIAAIAAAVLARLDAARLLEGGLLRAKRRERLAGFGRG
ncbi:Acetyl-coenzyme A carboxylase carboxyl transferase subunit alpha [uncultured Alphaproteobacteria bacterium]|uniref:acetyl-CoA carboxytransferase n=1 Tax=uncultured Alphaproteobacteria bacterium TaxID=91750 RepID=A0A212KI99_9PROT|nr:Acetyl-coenzyme A carboxylase carboxyl transferase subunit alpha [uncultured Alphaproteobacteria bacterium]